METISELEAIEIFGDNLRDLMEDVKINQSELAKESRLTQCTISKYLNKQRMPSMKAIMNLCYALNCDYNDLLPDYYLVR
jgi:transcriptional regulator with XRE-family HTH domain